MNHLTGMKLTALVVAAIFASGSVSVCLHGPDDEHVHGIVARGMPDHGQGASSVDHAKDCDGHEDGHDHHFCACACHSPTEPTQPFTMVAVTGTVRQMTSCPVVLTTSNLPIPYRPPIANA